MDGCSKGFPKKRTEKRVALCLLFILRDTSEALREQTAAGRAFRSVKVSAGVNGITHLQHQDLELVDEN